MNSDNFLVLILSLIIVSIVAIPVSMSVRSDNLIKEYIDKGMDPFGAACIVTGSDKACLRVK